MPGTALLGPVYTGATTKSVAQTSLSFGTNQIINMAKEAKKKSKKEAVKIVKKIENLNSEIKSKDFYASVKSLYLQGKQKKEKVLFHK